MSINVHWGMRVPNGLCLRFLELWNSTAQQNAHKENKTSKACNPLSVLHPPPVAEVGAVCFPTERGPAVRARGQCRDLHGKWASAPSFPKVSISGAWELWSVNARERTQQRWHVSLSSSWLNLPFAASQPVTRTAMSGICVVTRPRSPSQVLTDFTVHLCWRCHRAGVERLHSARVNVRPQQCQRQQRHFADRKDCYATWFSCVADFGLVG